MVSFVFLLSLLASGSALMQRGPTFGARPPTKVKYLPGVDDVPNIMTSFVSPSMQVYMEDTDSYGVVYNANYLRAYDRALQTTVVTHKWNDEWTILSCEQQKFKKSPQMGDSYIVQGYLVETSSEYDVWDLAMTSPDGSIVYHQASKVKVGRPSHIPNPAPFVPSADTTPKENSVLMFRDQFDSNLKSHIPLRNLMTLFEMTSTNCFGGPLQTQKLEDEGIFYIVSSVSELTLVDLPQYVRCQPGQQLTIESDVRVVRGGMKIEFHHTAMVGDIRVAQGVVTTIAISKETGRPTKNVPEWFLHPTSAPDATPAKVEAEAAMMAFA